MVARAWAERESGRKWERAERTSAILPRAEVRGIDRSGGLPRAESRGVEEMPVQNEAVSLCLLLNRRTKTMRVIDFRAGPSHAKRVYILKLAAREGMEKVYTLVERDEVSTWMKLGFAKEANIPGFYKRSDAFLLGLDVASASLQMQPREIVDDDDDLPNEAPSAAHHAMEKVLVAAKKQVKLVLDRQLPPTKLAPMKEADMKKSVEKALRTGRALTAFEPFGRDVERRYFQVTARGGFELVASTEAQSCFGNAYLELLTAPKTEAERAATLSALRTICDRLLEEGTVSCFALAPSDDVALATAFVFNGFRRTGLLVNHMLVDGERKDAIVWSRKLANPSEE